VSQASLSRNHHAITRNYRINGGGRQDDGAAAAAVSIAIHTLGCAGQRCNAANVAHAAGLEQRPRRLDLRYQPRRGDRVVGNEAPCSRTESGAAGLGLGPAAPDPIAPGGVSIDRAGRCIQPRRYG
jgi:hypothetical protein